MRYLFSRRIALAGVLFLLCISSIPVNVFASVHYVSQSHQARFSSEQSKSNITATTDIQPAWWNSTTGPNMPCDYTNYKNYTGVTPVLLTSWRGIEVCGPAPTTDHPVQFIPNPNNTTELEFECPELVKRYLLLLYDLPSVQANGYQVVDAYTSAYPNLLKKITPSMHIFPFAGDVLSYGTTNPGHTSIVTNVANKNPSTGSADVTVIEQNISGLSNGTETMHMSNWQMTGIAGTVASWMTFTSWPTFGYDIQHTHYNPVESILNTTNVSHLTLDWTPVTTSGAIERISSPIIADGIAYIGDDTDTLYAYNTVSGALLWSYSPGNDGFWPSASFVNGIIYVGDESANLTALDAITGARLWKITMPGGTLSSPTVANNVIYVGLNNGQGFVAAFNASNGSLLWNQTLSNQQSGSPAIVNGVVYATTINSSSSKVYALNAQTGKILWSGPISSGGSGVAVSNGIVYTVAYTQGGSVNLYAFKASGCGKSSCSPLWVKPGGGSSSSLLPTPAVANGVVYLGSAVNNAPVMDAYNAKTGKILWSWTGASGDAFGGSSAAIANGIVYDATGDGNLYAFKASGCGGATCSPLWTYHLGTGIGTNSSPAVLNGMVCIGAYNQASPFNGILFAFHLPGMS